MKDRPNLLIRLFFWGALIVIPRLSLQADVVAPSTPSAKVEPIPLVDYPNTAFKIGERLKFALKYEFIGAGSALMVINEGPVINGRETIHLESKAESNNFVDKFFKVRDVNSSTVDKRSMMSLLFHQNLREGGYKVMRNTMLDYVHRSYHYERTRKGKTNQESGPIDRPLHDILSAFFFFRTLPLKPGEEYSITVFSDKEVYALKVKVNSKIQQIEVPAGKFDCLRVEPTQVGEDSIFRAEGKMTIWLTNDEKKMPVLLRSKVFIGAVDAELLEYELGK